MPEETRYPLSIAPPSLVDYGRGAPSPKTAYRNSDTVDFRDVFGGPPRRTSVHEMRYSYTEGSDSFGVSDRRIGEMSFRDPWTGVEEKPVFGGGESANRRRYLRGDFFDDIFKGNESPSSTPRNVFSSSPGSRALSPARPLPPRADGLGSPSLPSQLSLPDKLGRGMDSPTLGSTHSSYKDSASNGASSPRSPKTTVFGFSTRAVPAKEETRHANQASYRPSPLSQQLLESQESAGTTKSSGESDDLKKGADSPGEVPQFHFSIYKWANKGIPLVTPLRRINGMKLKRRSKTEVSSFTEGPETPTHVPEPVSAAVHNVDSSSNTSEQDTASFGTEHWVRESSLAKDEDVAVHDVLQSERGGAKSDTKAMKSDQSLKDERRQEPEAASKPELKPLHSFIHSEDDEPGSGAYTTDGKTRGRESVQRSSKKSHENIAANKSFKKHDEELSVPKNEAATKVPSQEPPKDAHDSTGKRRAKGRVKEFIKIFNHEPPSKPKSGVSPQDQSSNKSKDGGTVEASQQANHQNGVNEKLNRPYVAVPQKEPDMVDRPPKQSQAEDPTRNTAKSSSNGTTSAQTNSPASRTESVPKGARVTAEEADESSHTNFTIKELPQDENKQGQYAGDNEEIQATDAKIRQWSRGKEGNIRSLLSTLQYVLWPGNGWKPVPLVDIIEGPAVKRAYQKAMLCLHPDKLQQKGASSHQKYIAEKVFDILQEAWDHFNTLGGL